MIGLSVFARLRSVGARTFRQMADKLAPPTNGPYSTPGWDHIPQGLYDYMPKGTHVAGPADKFLLVPKNRYRVVVLPEQPKRFEDGVGWLTEDNSPEGYDQLWGNGSNLEIYRAEGNHAREKLKVEIIDQLSDAICLRAKVADIGCGVGDLLHENSSSSTTCRSLWA